MRGLHVKAGALYIECKRLCLMTETQLVEGWVRRSMACGVGVDPCLRNMVVKEPPWPVEKLLPEPVLDPRDRLRARPVYHGTPAYWKAHGDAVWAWLHDHGSRPVVVKARGKKLAELAGVVSPEIYAIVKEALYGAV